MQTKEQKAAYMKAWHEANREKILARTRAYYEANREEKLAKNKAYYSANRNEILTQKKAYRETNSEKLEAYHKTYRFKNREARSAQGKVYYAAHLNEHLARVHKRRAKEAGAKIGDPKAILAWIKSWKTETPLACHYCKSLSSGKEMTIDHVIPMSVGGPHDLTNLVVCCNSCNASKQDKLPTVWLARTS